MPDGDQPLSAPDRVQPDKAFLDGDHVYELSVLPAAFPVRMAQTDGGTASDFGLTILMVLGLLVVGVVARFLDRRWKVVVMRRGMHRRSPWIVVGVEFVPTVDAAEVRRAEIVREWVPGTLATAPGIPSDQLRKMRRRTRRGN